MREWLELPMWVPFYGGHLAAVLTVPARTPRALVVLLQQGGTLRSHKIRMWTRAARALAVRDIASIRFDYPGSGDSTGEPHLDLESPPVEEAIAVAEVGRRITGVNEVAVVGNCLGSRTSFAMATRMDSCTAVGSVVAGRATELLKKPAGSIAGRTARGAADALDKASSGWAGGRAVRRVVRRMPRLTEWLRRWMKARLRGGRLASDVETALRSRRCFFLLLGDERSALRFERSVKRIAAAGLGGSVEVRNVPAKRLKAFRIPPDLQPIVIEALVQWMDGTMPVMGEISSEPPTAEAVQGAS